jgi:methyltransferase (TIGR00027 family)
MFGEPPKHVSYMAIDFNQESLGRRLAECGYDERRKTLFIWQGVTEYLTPEAVDKTLAFVHDRSAPGSSIIFDYVDPTILKGAPKHGEVSSLRRYGRLSGETLVFGIRVDEAETFLVTRGFASIKNADHTDLERLYFANAKVARNVASGYAIASAVVPAASSPQASEVKE